MANESKKKTKSYEEPATQLPHVLASIFNSLERVGFRKKIFRRKGKTQNKIQWGGGGKVSYNIIFLKWLHIPGRKRRGEEEGKEVEEEKNFFKKSFVSLPLTFAYF